MKILFALIASIITFFLLQTQEYNISMTISIVVFVAILWITEAIPLYISALLIPLLISIFGIMGIKEILKPFASSVVFLVFGGLALSAVIEYNKVDKWIAFNILRFSNNSPKRLLILIMLTSALLSMFISNTATAALLLPVIIGLSKTYSNKNYIKMLLLATAYSASIGGIATLIGSPPNAIAAGLLDINFLEWFKYNFFLSIIMLCCAGVVLWLFFKPDVTKIDLNLQKPTLDKKGKLVLLVTGIVIFLWFFSPILKIKFLNTTSIALLGIVLIFIFKLIPYKEFERRINWGILLLLGGGLALGYALDKSKAALFLANELTSLINGMPYYLLLILLVALGVFLTELISNTAVTAQFAPILISTASIIGIEKEALVLPFAVATSMAFMLPIATPPNALVFSTHYIKQKEMMKVGIILNIIAILVISNWYYFKL